MLSAEPVRPWRFSLARMVLLAGSRVGDSYLQPSTPYAGRARLGNLPTPGILTDDQMNGCRLVADASSWARLRK
jgi:hypothetical protein